MNIFTKPNICIGLYTSIFFVQRQQKSIYAPTPAMGGGRIFFNFIEASKKIVKQK